MGGQTISTSETRIEAMKLQSSAYGVTIPLAFGVPRISGNLVWYGGFKAIPHTTSQGGKGGVKVQQTTYTYTANVMMGLCHGRISSITRIWRGKKLYSGGVPPAQLLMASELWTPPVVGTASYTVSHAATFAAMAMVVIESTGSDDGGGMLQLGWHYTVEGGAVILLPAGDFVRGRQLRVMYQYTTVEAPRTALDELGLSFLPGEIAQPAWSALSAYPAQELGYSGLAVVAGQDYDLGTGAQVDNHMFEVVAPLAYHLDATTPDVDPSLMLREVLTNSRAGASFPTAALDAWQTWSDFCVASGLLVSPAITEQVSAAEIIRTAAQLTNTGPVWSAGQLKMIPYADEAISGRGRTYLPNTTPVYDLDDECYTPRSDGDSPLLVELKSPSDRHNHVRVEYLARANQYTPAIAEATDKADIDSRGRRTMPRIVRAHWICEEAPARLVAQMLQQRSLYVCSEYVAPLPWHFALLEPMDLVTLSDLRLQMDKVPARVIEIEESEEGDLQVRAEDYPPGTASAAIYPSQPGIGFAHDYNVPPGDVDAPVFFEAPVDLTKTGLEVYAAVKGSGANWGGCSVWVSLDGTSYRRVARVEAAARYGQLTTSVGASVNITTSGQLVSATAEEAATLQTLCYIGGANPEYLAYTTATLIGAGAYTLGGLVRAAYDTAQSLHEPGDMFVRVDEAIAKSGPLELDLIGKTLHFKFTSFNIYGAAEQGLADVDAYTYLVTGEAYDRGLVAGGRHYLQEAEPEGPRRGDLWKKPSTGDVKRWSGTAWETYATNGADWTLNLTGRPKAFRVAARGLSSTTHPIEAGLYNGETGAALFGGARSYALVRIRRSDGAITHSQYYDVFALGTDPGNTPAYPRGAAELVAALNATGPDHIVVVYSFDEPQTNRLTGGLPEAMYRCGASRSVFGKPSFKQRSAYILIGVGGCGEGNGFEGYRGDVNADPNAWLDMAFLLTAQGQLIVSGTGTIPTAHRDFGDVTTSDVQAQAITEGGVTINSTTTGGSDSSGLTTASSFYFGPSITMATNDRLEVSVAGLHVQRLFFNAPLARIEVRIEIDNGGTPIEIGKRRKYMLPLNAAGQETNLPIEIAAQAVPGAGVWDLMCWYTVTALDSTGAAVSALRTFDSSAEWRVRRVKR